MRVTPVLLKFFFACCLPLLASAPTVAENYYRWTDAAGVVHYGSRPPDGVDAVKIDTFGKSKGTQINEDLKRPGSEQSKAEDTQQALKDQRQQQCEDERNRLSLLTSSGSRIKMKQPDGSTRYLSPEELAKEVETSREFIEQACQ